ncbi:hypothetical protein IT570_03395 [Candidatus Sumerlaeota bacterium]|nr:hypothetical protein [Candidatus Sumerlaeota bacterium]
MEKLEMDETLKPFLAWYDAGVDVIEAIGPPGDYGYESREGKALYRIIEIGDVVHDEVFDQRQMAQVIVSATEAIGKITWPRDVKNRLPAFQRAWGKLKECSDVLAAALLDSKRQKEQLAS